MSLPKPPYDAELGTALAKLQAPPTITRDMIPMMREELRQTNTAETQLAGKSVTHEERKIPGPGCEITLSILRRQYRASSPTDERPGIYYIAGGGMICGNRFLGISMAADWVEACDAVCISVEYRQAPENPDPAPIEDCYAGLKWVGEHLSDLNIDPKRLMVVGMSAGGGLAAGLALLVRDRGGPSLCAQLLVCPMLDDRNETLSSKQYYDEGTWSGATNAMAWGCYLGSCAGGDNVSVYAAPARATDLSHLPPAFIDVGSAEVFRDEDVAYASRLWAAGVQVELHVWPGAFHGFDAYLPSAALSQIAINTRTAWVHRTFAQA